MARPVSQARPAAEHDRHQQEYTERVFLVEQFGRSKCVDISFNAAAFEIGRLDFGASSNSRPVPESVIRPLTMT